MLMLLITLCHQSNVVAIFMIPKSSSINFLTHDASVASELACSCSLLVYMVKTSGTTAEEITSNESDNFFVLNNLKTFLDV